MGGGLGGLLMSEMMGGVSAGLTLYRTQLTRISGPTGRRDVFS